MTRDFGNEVFAGAATYYAKYRPAYPTRLFADIVETFGLDGTGTLLDLGCGTGELAIPLAKYFQKVLAVDPDLDMLKIGAIKAKKQRISNIQWQKGSSKGLNSLKGPFRLVSMGQSFHWMDQAKVLDGLYDLLEPDGGLIIIGTEAVEQEPMGILKDQAIKKLLEKYLGLGRRAGSKMYTPPPEKYAQLLPNSKFGNFQERKYDVIIRRDIDEIVGNLFSMSWALKSHFGGRSEAFENELRHELETISSSRKFQEKIRFSMYTLAK